MRGHFFVLVLISFLYYCSAQTHSFLQSYSTPNDFCVNGKKDNILHRGCICSSDKWSGERCNIISECQYTSFLGGYCPQKSTSLSPIYTNPVNTKNDAICVIATVLSSLSLFALTIQASKDNTLMRNFWRVLCIKTDTVKPSDQSESDESILESGHEYSNEPQLLLR